MKGYKIRDKETGLLYSSKVLDNTGDALQYCYYMQIRNLGRVEIVEYEMTENRTIPVAELVKED